MFAPCDVAITQLTSKTGFGGLRPARITGHSKINCFWRQDTERAPSWGLWEEADPGYQVFQGPHPQPGWIWGRWMGPEVP